MLAAVSSASGSGTAAGTAAGSVFGGSASRDAVVAIVREVVEEERRLLAAGFDARDVAALAAEVDERLAGLGGSAIGTVINATGVIVHTNLGRAPWSEAAIQSRRGGRRRLPLPRARP